MNKQLAYQFLCYHNACPYYATVIRSNTGLSSCVVKNPFVTGLNQPIFVTNGMETTLTLPGWRPLRYTKNFNQQHYKNDEYLFSGSGYTQVKSSTCRQHFFNGYIPFRRYENV